MEQFAVLLPWGIGLIVFCVIVILLGILYKRLQTKKNIMEEEALIRSTTRFQQRLLTEVQIKNLKEELRLKDEIIQELRTNIEERLFVIETILKEKK